MKNNFYLIKKVTPIIIFYFILTIGNLSVYAEETENNKLSGAELWSQNCSRCHNMRAPQEFNDSQWSIILAHMRVIANLPGEQAREILKFLQETNNPPQEQIESSESAIKSDKFQKQEITEGNIENGEKLFSNSCAACHGVSGKGDGPAAVTMKPRPKNLNDYEYMKNLTDEELFNGIKYGGASVGKSPFMPAWGSTLSDQEIIDIILYLRSLSNETDK